MPQHFDELYLTDEQSIKNDAEKRLVPGDITRAQLIAENERNLAERLSRGLEHILIDRDWETVATERFGGET